MKKILFMCGMYHPNYSANGVCVKNIIDEFIKNKYDVSCICNDSIDFHGNDIQDGCKIYRVKRKFLQKMEDYFTRINKPGMLHAISILKRIK